MRRRLLRTALTVMVVTTLFVFARPAGEPPPISRSAGTGTSREALEDTVGAMTQRLSGSATDSDAAVRLADALLRQARVLNHGGLARRAEAALDIVIAAHPSDYMARRMRATVYLAQHRFHDAMLEAHRCQAMRRSDPWIDGVIGDAALELGDLPAAVAAFDRMMEHRPDAAAYARASYARELQGDVSGATTLMRMADAATSAHDIEAQAWHAAQLGHLLLLSGDSAGARREYARADALFPGHPFAHTGLARVELADGRPAEALARLTSRLSATPTATDFALAGDAHARLGHDDEAERHYRLAEAMWTSDTPDERALQQFRRERGRQ